MKMKTLAGLCLLIIGVALPQETVETAVEYDVHLSADIATKDSVTVTTPYTGFTAQYGEDWKLAISLDDEGSIVVEEAKFGLKAGVGDVGFGVGVMPIPYGIVWGTHRPFDNSFVTIPRDNNEVMTGVSLDASVVGVNVNAFYGGDVEGETYWAARAAYKKDFSIAGINLGYSTNSDSLLSDLVDVSFNVKTDPISVGLSTEYNLDDESYWARVTLAPGMLGAFKFFAGINSDESLSYGLGYKANDHLYIKTEATDDDGIFLQAAYKF